MLTNLLFDHIPKTGGKSIHSVLQQLLGSDACSPTLNTTFSNAWGKFSSYSCVSGHITFLPGSNVAGCSLFTVLRNPVDRIISQYFFAHIVSENHGSYFDKKCRQLSFQDFFFSEDKIIRETISNQLIKNFYPLGAAGTQTSSQSEQLLAAKKALQEKYFFVGLTERMDESMDLLCWHLGRAPVDNVPRVNVTNAKMPTAPESKRVRKYLTEIIQADLELYDFAINLYDQERRAVLIECTHAKSKPKAQLLDTKNSENDLEPGERPTQSKIRMEFGNHKVELIECIVSAGVFPGPVLLAGEVALLQFRFKSNADIDDLTMGMSIHDESNGIVFGTNTSQSGYLLKSRKSQIISVHMRVRIDLAPGKYWVAASLHPGAEFLKECYHFVDRLCEFEVAGNWGAHFEGKYKLYPDLGLQDINFTESNDAKFMRLAKYVPSLTDFKASLDIVSDIGELEVLETIAIEIKLANTGQQSWLSFGKKPVRVSYHWLDSQKNMTVQDGERTLLPRDIQPGESISMWVKIVAPPSPGVYYFQLSPVQEFVGWFDANGFLPPELTVTVTTVGTE